MIAELMEAWGEPVPGKWISVQRHLPKDLQAVLAYATATQNICIAVYHNREWYHQRDFARVRGGVSHWQPLPEIPANNQTTAGHE